MRLRKPLTEAICPACSLRYMCNDHEIAPEVIRCPGCGHECRIKYPPSFEEAMGCGPLTVAATVFFLLATLAGGGGVFGVLLGATLGLAIPAALAVLAYHVLRGSDE